MRVVILTETFAKNMGYAERIMPKYLVRLGVEVHVVTMDLPPYYQLENFKETYSGFTNYSDLIPGTVEELDGFKLHVIGHEKVLGYMRMVGLREKLNELKPDIVQTFSAIGHLPLDAALFKILFGYKLFTGNHTTASVYPLANRKISPADLEYLRNFILRAIPGRFISLFTEKCYGATCDCADVATRFFGVEKQKIDICPLGVDTDIFFPVMDNNKNKRDEFRKRLGFSESEIVCIYTGRFTKEKNPLILARAIEELNRRGEPYRAIFLGNGEQAGAIAKLQGCIVHPFVPVNELPDYFRASDIGVWPTQESLSMLDAAACGLPIIVNDTIAATERIDGNGIVYRLNDVNDMVRALLLLRDFKMREKLGSTGSLKMKNQFSWEAIAKRRLKDYESSVSKKVNI